MYTAPCPPSNTPMQQPASHQQTPYFLSKSKQAIRSHEGQHSQLPIPHPRFPACFLRGLQERQPLHGVTTTCPAEGQEGEMPSDDRSGEEVRSGKAAVALCVVQIGERAVWHRGVSAGAAM